MIRWRKISPQIYGSREGCILPGMFHAKSSRGGNLPPAKGFEFADRLGINGTFPADSPEACPYENPLAPQQSAILTVGDGSPVPKRCNSFGSFFIIRMFPAAPYAQIPSAYMLY